jgi:hypothetical protein
MGYDELERNATSIAAQLADPSIEIETGRFPHGGERLLREWYSGAGLRTSRSRAVRGTFTEFDAVGRVLWHSNVSATDKT